MQHAPVVVDVPHAGRGYSPAFLQSARLSAHGLRKSEDAFVDILFADAARFGAPILCAEFPRAYLDVNREPFELDPRMFHGQVPAFANTRSLRVMSGLGTVPKVVGDGQEIYPGPIPVDEALHRIESVYRPYHAALRGLIDRTVGRFGACILIDAHSMPSTSVARERAPRPDIVLGDRFGASAAGWIVEILESELRRAGFRVARNRPYAGGYITEAYGQPRQGRHAVQIEINRALYMDERAIEPSPAFERVREAMREAIGAAILAWSARIVPSRLAAE
jgi:N-formylglutamate amidohydrolase